MQFKNKSSYFQGVDILLLTKLYANIQFNIHRQIGGQKDKILMNTACRTDKINMTIVLDYKPLKSYAN